MHHGAIGWLLALFLAVATGPLAAQPVPPASDDAPARIALAGGLLEQAPSPHVLPDLAFVDVKGRTRHLSDFRGRVILLNLWATWCPPCRRELPTLEHLQALLGGSDFEVVALSIDRGGLAAVTSYFDQFDVRALHVYVDASARALSQIGGKALPTTLLIERDGRELARRVGPADWDRPDVVELLRRTIAASRSTVPTRANADDGKIARRSMSTSSGRGLPFIVSLQSN